MCHYVWMNLFIQEYVLLSATEIRLKVWLCVPTQHLYDQEYAVEWAQSHNDRVSQDGIKKVKLKNSLIMS